MAREIFQIVLVDNPSARSIYSALCVKSILQRVHGPITIWGVFSKALCHFQQAFFLSRAAREDPMDEEMVLAP